MDMRLRIRKEIFCQKVFKYFPFSIAKCSKRQLGESWTTTSCCMFCSIIKQLRLSSLLKSYHSSSSIHCRLTPQICLWGVDRKQYATGWVTAAIAGTNVFFHYLSVQWRGYKLRHIRKQTSCWSRFATESARLISKTNFFNFKWAWWTFRKMLLDWHWFPSSSDFKESADSIRDGCTGAAKQLQIWR